MALSMKMFSLCFRRQIRRQFNTASSFKYDKDVRVRFAPSPTGFMHLGSLRTAFYNYLFAKSKSGRFVVRIEDTDQTRIVDGAIEKILETLHWAKIHPDEGPLIGGNFGPYIQSQRTDLYNIYVNELLKKGAAYKCFCTKLRLNLIRKDAMKHGEIPKYDNKCRHLSETEIQEKIAAKTPYVIRFKLNTEDHEPFTDLVFGHYDVNIADYEGDPVIMKSDGYPTYHFANVVDDHLMEITHVLRGQEWQVSTPKHLLMYKAFGWSPPQYGHLPLIMNSDGTKLSKRQGDIQISFYQDKGYAPDAVLKYLTLIGGGYTQTVDNSIEYDSLEDLVTKFSVQNMSSHSGHIDIEKLEQVNKVYLQRALNDDPDLITEQAMKVLRKHLQSKYQDRNSGDLLDKQHVTDILCWAMKDSRICKITDLTEPEWEFLWKTPSNSQIQELCEKSSVDICKILQDCYNVVCQLQEFQEYSLKKALSVLAKEKGINMKLFMHILRVSLSGLQAGPPVVEMMSILGKEASLRRLKHAEHFINDVQCVDIKS
uniref:Nondiscriminating glutamyl-tRNA synthetase EARS2, mitochondrial n=1 Tax=Magallana gigas TaxID=29159 RepID=K1RFG9_MAGGI|eukprot:XP_011440191.1 PREDICTED: probable glutamate--tRNA ligase, mitochondrial [Crassostrea gigas]